MTTSLYIRKFPATLHTALRLEAVRRGVTLREVLVEATSEWLKRQKPKRGKK